jgi:hypothetical protein
MDSNLDVSGILPNPAVARGERACEQRIRIPIRLESSPIPASGLQERMTLE